MTYVCRYWSTYLVLILRTGIYSVSGPLLPIFVRFVLCRSSSYNKMIIQIIMFKILRVKKCNCSNIIFIVVLQWLVVVWTIVMFVCLTDLINNFSNRHPVVLSIILKWSKIYTFSNTTLVYLINLNKGDWFRPMQAIIRPKYLQKLKCPSIQCIVQQCHGIPFIIV
jgi:hypothetical protein